MIDRRRVVVLAIALAILLAVVALPALAADPSGSPSTEPSATATTEPASTPTATPVPETTAAPAATVAPETTEAPRPDKVKPDKAKGPKTPEVAVTMTGTVATRTDADGDTEYTMAADGRTLVLDAGPAWFFGDDHPLEPYVGTSVTITGASHEGSDDVEVATVDGTLLREPGRPAWAGGWKAVGEQHPGWTQEKWDRWQEKMQAKAKAHGTECWPPGHCKPDAEDGEGG